MRIAPILMLALLAGCAVARVPTCPTIAQYTPEFQAEASRQLDDVPDGSPLDVMMQDYGALRDQVRACERRQ